MSTMQDCLFPKLSPRGSYNKGCKCSRCLGGQNLYSKIVYKRNSKKYCATKKKYRMSNAERMSSLYYKKRLKKYYGISVEEYDTLLKKQNYACAICEKSQAQLTSRLHVDHDHITKRIRGLLCHSCNIALGFLKDSTQLLRIAITYLNRSKLDEFNNDASVGSSLSIIRPVHLPCEERRQAPFSQMERIPREAAK